MAYKTVTLKVSEICGHHCVGFEDSFKLLGEILRNFDLGYHVCLDFTGVITITSSFLNASIGKLIGKLSKEDFETRLSNTGLDENDNQLMELVIMNAKEYFKKSTKEKIFLNGAIKYVVNEG